MSKAFLGFSFAGVLVSIALFLMANVITPKKTKGTENAAKTLYLMSHAHAPYEQQMIKTMRQTMTTDQINQAIHFYQSPAGQSLVQLESKFSACIS